MTADEIVIFIERILASFPDRMSGNEVNPMVADEIRSFAVSDRQSLLDALRQYLAFRVSPARRQPKDAVREARLWLALDVANELGLSELKPDIESLLQSVRSGKTLRPVHEKGVARYLKSLNAQKGHPTK